MKSNPKITISTNMLPEKSNPKITISKNELLMKLRQQISRLILTMYLRDPNKRYK
jgi:hypothetical protein